MTIPLPNTLRNKKIVISLLGKEATFTFRNFPEPEEVLKINLRKLLLQTRLWKTPRCKSPKLTSFEVTGITISHGKTTNKNPIFFFFFFNFFYFLINKKKKILIFLNRQIKLKNFLPIKYEWSPSDRLMKNPSITTFFFIFYSIPS